MTAQVWGTKVEIEIIRRRNLTVIGLVVSTAEYTGSMELHAGKNIEMIAAVRNKS